MLPGKSVINLQNELSDSPSVEIAASCIRRCILLEGEQENCDQLTLDHFLSDYASLVDDIKGINNYAAASLKLAEGTKNDSTRWRSSLQTDDLIHAVNEDRDDYKRIQDCQASEKPIGTQNIARLTDLLQKTLMLQFDIPPPTELEPNARQDQVSFKADSTWTASGNKVGLKRPLLPSSTQAGNLLDVKRTNAEQSNNNESRSPFRTANSVLLDNLKAKQSEISRSGTSGLTKKSLGARRGPKSPFILPVPSNERADSPSTAPEASGSLYAASEPIIDERLKQFDQKVIDLIMSEIMDSKSTVTWQDIAGLEVQKKALQEVVILPMLRPDLFTGLRGPPKGLLLFGPPGTGKTLIGKCIASQSKSTFFCISASSLTSKWVGEGEKMVRALFAIGRIHQPAVIFIDEVDSLLTQRSETEHESSRRIKTEFLVQLDGVATGEEERLLFVGATNRPQELDEAARRRFVKRLYIPLPDENARQQIVRHLLSQQLNSLRDEEYTYIAEHTDGYSGADMANLCREAAMGPIRSLSIEALQSIQADQVRPVELTDFEVALRQVRPSVSPRDLEQYRKWNKQYGSFDV